jgi:hypothetical protein
VHGVILFLLSSAIRTPPFIFNIKSEGQEFNRAR